MANEYFDPSHDNRFARCVELELSEGQGTTATSLTLLAEVRCGAGRLSSSRFTARIGVTQVELSLQINGGRIAGKSRYGERIRPGEERVESTTTETHVVEAKGRLRAQASAGSAAPLPFVGASASGDVKRGLKKQTSRKYKSTEVTSRVQATGGDSWSISEPNGAPLDGTYLRDDALCRIESPGTIKKVTATVSVPKKNVKVLSVTNNETGTEMRLGTNRQKIIQLLVAESLGTDGDMIVISESRLLARDA